MCWVVCVVAYGVVRICAKDLMPDSTAHSGLRVRTFNTLPPSTTKVSKRAFCPTLKASFCRLGNEYPHPVRFGPCTLKRSTAVGAADHTNKKPLGIATEGLC
jgi:hypothetical protein